MMASTSGNGGIYIVLVGRILLIDSNAFFHLHESRTLVLFHGQAYPQFEGEIECLIIYIRLSILEGFKMMQNA